MLNDKTVKLLNNLIKGLDNNLQNKHDNIAKLPKSEWIINNWLPKGYVTALFGNNGKEKLLFLQQLATSLTSGTTFLGNKSKPLHVLFLISGDKSNEIMRKQLDINDHYNLNMTNITELELVFYKKGWDLFTKFNEDNLLYQTEFLEELSTFISDSKTDLVIVDNFQDFYKGGLHKNSKVFYLIDSTLNYIAQKAKCGVLVSNTTVDCSESEFKKLYNAFNLCWHLTQPDFKDTSQNQRLLIRSTLNNTYSHDEYKALQLDNGFFTDVSSSGASENNSKEGE